jgi:hypothetical protein
MYGPLETFFCCRNECTLRKNITNKGVAAELAEKPKELVFLHVGQGCQMEYFQTKIF